MKSILLTSTSLVMLGGLAAAETSITWSGVANAGMARTGKAAAVATQLTAEVLLDLRADFGDSMESLTAANHTATVTASAGTTEALFRTEVATAISFIKNHSLNNAASLVSNNLVIAELEAIIAMADTASTGVAIVNTSDFETYSEVNATVTGSVSMDNGMSITAAVSVDAGQGYNFADDEGFDAAAAGRVGLDNITLNAGTLGTFKIDQDAVTHLVDGDDDGNADILYTNTFGAISFSAAVDVSTDVDDNALAAVAAIVTSSGAGGTIGDTTVGTAAVVGVAADVQWSAKVSMPVAGGTAYVAMDEEGGNVFGASTTVGGIGVSFSSSLEALEEGTSVDRSNTVGLTYVMGAVTAGASWNSKEDGDQWGISAAYTAADGISFSASTDEGSDWAISGSYAMGEAASVVGGVNYTEDAYLGLSFAF